MSERDAARELLIEAALSAFRERDASGRIRASAAWLDLTPEDREELFRRQSISREIEAAIHEDGLTSTGRELVERVLRVPQAPHEP